MRRCFVFTVLIFFFLSALAGAAMPQAQNSATATASAPKLPKPSPEIEKLKKLFLGNWSSSEEFAPVPNFPKARRGTGTDLMRSGPGGLSVVSEYRSQNPAGKFYGLGVYTWDEKNQSYTLYWIDNVSPDPKMFSGKWEGAQLIFTLETTLDDKATYIKQTYSDFTPWSFSFTQEASIEGGPLARQATVHFRRMGGKPMAQPKRKQ
jgi:hypothetical protein